MYIVGKEEALRFANERLTKSKETALRQITGDQCRSYVDDHPQMLKDALVIDGVTRLVDVYTFREFYYIEDGKKVSDIEFEGAAYAVQLIETGEIARPYLPYGKGSTFELSLMPEDQEFGPNGRKSFSGLRFEMPKPDRIGKGTTKKLIGWFDYLRAENEAKKEYTRKAIERNRKMQEAVKAKFPNAYIKLTNGGWMEYCQFSIGYLAVTLEALDDGGVSRSLHIDAVNVPSTAEMLGL